MRNIYKLIASEFFVALYFALPVQTLFFLAKGIPFSKIMILESFLMLAMLIFEIPTGILGDKLGRKWSLVIGAIVFIVSWVPWLLADTNFWLYALAEFITGIAFTFYSGSEEALMYDELKYINKQDKMQKYYGLYVGIRKIGVGISSLVGGYLAINRDMNTFYLLFYLSIIGEIISLIILLTIKESPRSRFGDMQAQAPHKAIALFKSGLKLIKSKADLRQIALLCIFSNPFAMILTYSYQIYFTQAGVGNEWFGWAAAIASLISVFTSIFAHKIEHWFGLERGLLLVTLIPPIVWILMGIFFNPLIAIILMIINWSIGNFREPIFSDYQNRHIDSHNRATVLSTLSFVGSIYVLILRPVFGYLIEYNMSFGFFALGLLIFAGSFFFRVKHVGNEEKTVFSTQGVDG